MLSFKLNNVCASRVDFDIEDGKVKNLVFHGGCPGNLQAISKLVEGLPPEEVIQKISGIKCGSKDTSCADQLAKALAQLKSR